jgi:aspartate/methionine/tyrosine aminotransferase
MVGSDRRGVASARNDGAVGGSPTPSDPAHVEVAGAGQGRIAPFYVMEMVRAAEERVAAGLEVLHLEVGQPSTGAPSAVRVRAEAALRSGDPLGYTEATGWRPLREAIAAHYRSSTGIDVDPGRIVTTVGSSVGFVLAFLAAFRPAARVAVSEPGYPCYRNTLLALGREPVGVPVGPETGYRLTPELLERAGPLDGVIVASPANPTGTILGRRDLTELMVWCRARGVRLVSDEIYHGLSFGKPTTSLLALDSSPAAAGIVVNSFSKYWSMTGWRLGWLVLPEALVVPVERLAQNLVICPSALAQRAAVGAFDATDELERHVARYRRNRSILLEGLAGAGLDRVAPADGAFYVYAEVDHLTGDSLSLCRRWLDELGVATTPGIDFDPVRGHRTVRFSFAGATTDVEEAVRRLAGWTARSG